MTNPNAQRGRIKLSNNINIDADDNFIKFLAQLGVPYAYTWLANIRENYDVLMRFKEKLDSHGITLYNVGVNGVAKSKNIHLATPERDRDIEIFQDSLRVLQKAGICATTFTWEPDQVWSNGSVPVRGGASGRFVDEGQLSREPVKHGRVYEKDELWDNFTYFMRQMMPVAEETGVRLALHPNDPPMGPIAGVDCLITSFDDYRKAFKIAGSKMLGMEFCCGCWLEGGDRFGDVIAGIKEFVADGRVIITHFRNVNTTLPVFNETFIDEGYMDMFELMKAFYEADYDGTLIYDHMPSHATPEITQYGGAGFAIGYIKALMNAASRA